MRYLVAAGTEAEARAWARQHRVRPCDLLVVDPACLPLRETVERKAAGAPLYGVPVVRLYGWQVCAPKTLRADLDAFLATLRPPLVQVV